MRKPNGKVMDAELLNQGEYGVDVQSIFEGSFYQSRCWQTRALALAEAEEKRSHSAASCSM